MAKTVGDLFIRVTAKDQQFKKQMRGVRQTIGGVGTSVGRLAGLFGMAFGAGAALSFAIKAASKYSGVFVKQMARLKHDMLKIQIATGKAFGPVFAEAIEDFKRFVGMTENGKINMEGLAEHARSLIDIGKAVFYWFHAIYKIGEAIGGVFLKLFEMLGLTSYSADQKAMSKGITRRELDSMQNGTPLGDGGRPMGDYLPMGTDWAVQLVNISEKNMRINHRLLQNGTPR